MKNVCRIFNDSVGVELCERTGRNPAYTYLSLGCSKSAEARMLAFARQQVGKPFSNIGMARSLIAPRQSDYSSFFCAELVAAVLKVGGLMSTDSNAGAATPYSLYKLYSKQAAATANPYALRSMTLTSGNLGSDPRGVQPGGHCFSFQSMSGSVAGPMATRVEPLLCRAQPPAPKKRSDSPPRAAFRLLSADRGSHVSAGTPGITLSLQSLASNSKRR